jgi:hypothetical protein
MRSFANAGGLERHVSVMEVTFYTKTGIFKSRHRGRAAENAGK